MRAVVYERYGPPEVLRFSDLPKPIPKDNEILIKIHATTVTTGDWRVRSLEVPFGFGLISRLVFGVLKPRKPVLGTELAGEVESVGRGVTQFAPGDSVFAFSGVGMGCHAEFKCMPETEAVALKPANLTFEEAAALSFGGTTALEFFRRARLRRGEQVLVNGASGCVGSAAVQLAKHFGATVTGVCSGANLALVKSLGADRVVDYGVEDFTRNGERYDVIVDTAGTAPYSRSRHSLTENGRLLLILGTLPDLLSIPWVAITSRRRVLGGAATGTADDLRVLAALAEDGEFKPVIGRTYPFDQIIAAHRYVDAGHKQGSVVVRVC